jgi:general nucleoside transport system ATP-binding protein
VAVLSIETNLEIAPVAERAAGPAAPVVLTASNIHRCFGDRNVINGIDIELRHGEILTLLGDNGCGKSTLLKIFSGDDAADSGTVFVTDPKRRAALRKFAGGSVPNALARGIAAIRWPLALVDQLTGFENIVLGSDSYWLPTSSRPAALSNVQAVKDKFDVRVETDVPVERLSAGDQFRVALLRALYHKPHVLLLDEPTAPLTPQDEQALIQSLKAMTSLGMAIMLATRDPEKAMAMGNRIAVLRGGEKIAEMPVADGDLAELTELLIGQPVAKPVLGHRSAGNMVLELIKVDVASRDPRTSLREVSLEVRAGEIIGVAGTAGNGQDTLAAVISGLVAPSQGRVKLFGRIPRQMNPALFVRVGIGRVPADCRTQGVVADLSVAENLALEDIRTDDFEHNGFIKKNAIRAHAHKMIPSYGIDAPSIDAHAAVLGDGEIQKLVLARVLDRNPYFILADHPTRGLDRRTCAEVHRRLATERGRDTAILLISDDIDELLTLSDWIGVLYEGRLTLPQPTRAFDRQSLGYMMGGQGSLAQDWTGWGCGT